MWVWKLVHAGVAACPCGYGSCFMWVCYLVHLVWQLFHIGVAAGPDGVTAVPGIFGCGSCSRKTLKTTKSVTEDTHTSKQYLY